MSREDFERRRTENFFAEWAEVHGHFYGTPLQPVKTQLLQGHDMLFDIDVQGAAQLKLTLDRGNLCLHPAPGHGRTGAPSAQTRPGR